MPGGWSSPEGPEGPEGPDGAGPAKTASSDGWRLVFEDSFDRSELGDGWFLRSGAAEIRGGRLFLSGAGATILIRRAFAPDVRIELEAEANPDLPPCDLSATLCGSEFWGYEYLFAFGGNQNRVSQILGGGARKVDPAPSRRIEPGRRYRLLAEKEGRRLTYWVDGEKLIESEDPDPVGGPGYDRAGLVTYNGMLVEWVKVHERTEPAPDGPRILSALPDLGPRWADRKLEISRDAESAFAPGEEGASAVRAGVAAYNGGRLEDARDAFLGVSPPTLLSVAGLAYVVGDLAYDERPGDQAELALRAAAVARSRPDDPRAADLALAAEWFRRLDIRSRDRRAATRLVMAGPERNPFHHKADLFRARYHHASAVEAGDRRRVAEALEIFHRLRELWPDVLALREHAGERVVWGEDLIREASEGPAWARHLEECFRRHHAVLRWWFTRRQSPDGQLGGGWGDDVEILRDWAPVASISSAGEAAIAGIERMADGVWDAELVDGYSSGIGDVEHSAEPSADALPGMLLLRYGDPRPIERNLRSARTIRERFLAPNERGRLQFRSAEFGAEGIRTDVRAGGDTGYHARPMRHFLWLAWYGIPEARDVFLSWCDAWRDVTVSAIGTKPAGFIPASIFFPSGGIDPPDGRKWYDPGAHYYGFPGIAKKIPEAQLAAFFLSGQRRYLEAVDAALRLALTGPVGPADRALPPDSPGSLLAHSAHLADRDILAVRRWLTRENVHDDFLRTWGTPAQRFAVDGDLDGLAARFEKLAEGLRTGWTRLTSEVLQTDRAGLPGAEDVFGAYTGAVRDLGDSGAPTFAVTWVTPGLEFAAVVTEATAERLRARVHIFSSDAWHVGVRPWRLRPGRYAVSVGEPVPAVPSARTAERFAWRSGSGRSGSGRTGSGASGSEVAGSEVAHVHRGAPVWVELPGGRTWIVDLRLLEGTDHPSPLPDLAVAPRDVRWEPEPDRARGPERSGSGGRGTTRAALRVTVHQVGGAAAGGFAVACEARSGAEGWPQGWPQGSNGSERSDGSEGWREVARVRVDGLPAIRGFEPVLRDVRVAVPPLPAGSEVRIVLDPDGEVDEICEENNLAAPGGPEGVSRP